MIRTIDREAPPDAPLVRERLANLERMTATQLRVRYAEVFGEQSRSGNHRWLLRRIAWRIQFDAEGSFAQRAEEQARALAMQYASESDIRFRPPKAPPPVQLAEPSVTMHVSAPRDNRLPPPGSVILRRFKGSDHRVTVMPMGFEYDGGHYKSLSAVAHAITGSHWNGMLFFGLSSRAKQGLAT